MNRVVTGLLIGVGVVTGLVIVDDDPALLQALPHTISPRLPEAKVDTSNSTQRALS